MDIVNFFEVVKTNSALCFVAGIFLGYFLHSIISHGFLSKNRGKPPSRYQAKKVDSSVKRSNTVVGLSEPSFDFTDTAFKAITPQRLGGVSLDPQGNELQ
ncbi:MAG: hypothetical protein ABL884_02495 [Methyloglobulus sp.]